ncbi:MAG: methyltransferase family protein [Candidatus Thorarchaeota archaeon]
MKGLDKLKDYLPDYQGRILYKFLIVALIVFLSSLFFQLLFDSVPRIFSGNIILRVLAPFTPVLGSLTILSIGFSLVYSFWRVRDKYLNKFGELAYQKAFKIVVTSIPMIFSIVAHSFFPSDFIIPFTDTQNINWYFAYPLLDYLIRPSIISFIIRISISIVFIAIMMILMRKVLKVFGIDYMGLVYIYYPEGSNIQDHEIYSILRHPTYHCLMLLMMGAFFLRFSLYSIMYFIIFIIGINIHIKFVEEKELIERFGEGYEKYKKKVPALFVKFKDLKKYFSFIFKKKQ